MASTKKVRSRGPSRQPFIAHSAKHGAARRQALPDRLDDRARAERKTAEVELGQAEVGDQLGAIAGKDPGRVVCSLVGLAALPMGAKVGHDDPEPARGDRGGVAELDPVDLRA